MLSDALYDSQAVRKHFMPLLGFVQKWCAPETGAFPNFPQWPWLSLDAECKYHPWTGRHFQHRLRQGASSFNAISFCQWDGLLLLQFHTSTHQGAGRHCGPTTSAWWMVHWWFKCQTALGLPLVVGDASINHPSWYLKRIYMYIPAWKHGWWFAIRISNSWWICV